MSSIRAEIWCAAFVRRHNDAGRICVVARKGDPVAGQVWIEVDHLNGTSSLFAQAPGAMFRDDEQDWVFQNHLSQEEYSKIQARLKREEDFDPDFWLLVLEDPQGNHGLSLVKSFEPDSHFS
ncbi:MAG: DUF1491 family protein [Devosiaceae bacterium]|nr:DUF1491 family protein [Devosiaceae bacterium]